MRERASEVVNLNRAGRWTEFTIQGLAIGDDGAIGLQPLPSVIGDMTETPLASAPGAPGALTATPAGDVYVCDRVHDRLWKWDACEQRWGTVARIGGSGVEPGEVRAPRGVLYHERRRALYVADTGNHRIQLFDAETLQWLAIWGRPGDAPGELDEPWGLVDDAEGNVYVVDSGNRRVQKFDISGSVIAEFWERLEDTTGHAGVPLVAPAAVAIGAAGDGERLFVLDAGSRRVIVCGPDGDYRESFGDAVLEAPMGLAVGDGVVEVGDNAHGRVWCFASDVRRRTSQPECRGVESAKHSGGQPSGAPLGMVRGFAGPVLALATGATGELLVLTGWSKTEPHEPRLTRAGASGAFTESGFLYGGPFTYRDPRSHEWYRLAATASESAPGAHVRLYFFASPDATPPPVVAGQAPWAASAIDLGTYLRRESFDRVWVRVPADATETMIVGIQENANDPRPLRSLRFVWVGVEFTSEGSTTRSLEQLRIEFAPRTYVDQLPAIYSHDAQERRLLERFMSLYGSLFEDVEAEIAGMHRLFDPMGARASWLEWLAGWLAVELSDEWDEARKRAAVAQAFESYARRGTAVGLRSAVRAETGIDVGLDEPLQGASVWRLPGCESATAERSGASLGFTTMLASPIATSAVLGRSAILGGSHVATEDNAPVPLFDDVAHRVSVRVHRGQLRGDSALDALRTVIEREKPAHVGYEICVIEPQLVVGFQATLGVDAVVGGPPDAAAAGTDDHPGGMVLGGERTGRVGAEAHIGRSTRLGGRGVDRSSVPPEQAVSTRARMDDEPSPGGGRRTKRRRRRQRARNRNHDTTSDGSEEP